MITRKPKIALCAAFSQGYEVASFVLAYPYPVALVATCDKDTSEFEGRIVRLARQHRVPCRRRVDVNSAQFIDDLAARAIDMVLLAWWPTIIKPPAIAAARVGWINMHPSYLPYNRGKHPYYWSIVEGTPFGVTLHFIDAGVDTGRILWQRRLNVAITDTGESLYAKAVQEIINLFKESYPQIVAGKLRARRQSAQGATFHRAAEIEQHSRIDLDRRYKARDLLNIIRGRTFRGGESAYFFERGKKYWVRVEIEEARGGKC